MRERFGDMLRPEHLLRQWHRMHDGLESLACMPLRRRQVSRAVHPVRQIVQQGRVRPLRHQESVLQSRLDLVYRFKTILLFFFNLFIEKKDSCVHDSSCGDDDEEIAGSDKLSDDDKQLLKSILLSQKMKHHNS